ncbi:hypothetical protein, partial [Pseudomonas aeruginosa]|uniref:hypothetical protein n=1 Tax=Pseudomonas aeruginosa TaxID=287 RepID=UPI003008A48E
DRQRIVYLFADAAAQRRSYAETRCSRVNEFKQSVNLLFHTLLFCFFYLTCFIPNFIRLKIKCAAGYNFAFRYFRTSYLPRIIPRFTDAPLILAKDLSMAGNVQEKQ